MNLKVFLKKLLNKWKYFICILYIFNVFYLLNLSRQVSYQQVNPNNNSKIEFSLSFCYDLSIQKEICEPSYRFAINKTDFPQDCNFELPIECHTKGFKDKTVGEILNETKRCKIENLVKIDRPTTKEYKIYFGNICVKNKFDVDLSSGKELINIIPEQKNQIFSVTISSKRIYENENVVYNSPIVNIFRRFCWMDPFPPQSNVTTKYHCSEDGRNIRFILDYFSVKSLPYPYTTNCLNRDETDATTQTKCYEDCVKKEKAHFFMTYRDSNDKSKVVFDNSSSMDTLVKKCLKQCENPDCNYGSFDVANIINDDSDAENGSISLEISSIDHRTEVIPFMPKITVAYCLILFIYVYFGLNVYEKLLKNLCLRTYFTNLNRKRRREKENKKLALFSLISLIVGLGIGFFCEWKFYDFGKDNRIVVVKKELSKEMSISTSICFDLTTILKNNYQNISYTNSELFEKSLNELNDLTWSVHDFKMRSSMRNSVGAVPIRHKEKAIYIFYRNFRKCFLIYYDTKNLFPHIYLQRKSHIFFNTSQFSHFYVEYGFKYPQIKSPEFLKSSLFTLRQTDFRNRICKRYSLQTDGCSFKDECLQNCVIKKYIASSSLPTFVNVRLNDSETLEYGKYKFNRDEKLYEKYLKECENEHSMIECNSMNITIRPKYTTKENHNISINLTPNLIIFKELENEDKLVVFNRILGILLILTGFSVREFVDALVSIYVTSFYTAMNIHLIKRLTNLVLFLLFLVHFSFLCNHIVNHQMLQISYKNFLKTINLPKIRLCYESGIDLSYNNYSKTQLDNLTISTADFFIGMNYLNDDFNIYWQQINETGSSIYNSQTFYLDNLKCFSISVKQTTPVARANIIKIDQLVTLFVRLKKVRNKRFLVYLNVENTIDLEWTTFLQNGSFYNLYFSIKEYAYNDDYYYLKNFRTSIMRLFNLHEEANTQRKYFDYLRKNYNDEQYVTTTILPLEDDKDLKIKNDQFNAFMHFRSIDGHKNDWDFTHNSEMLRFSYDLYKELPEKRDESVIDKAVVALRPNLSCLKNRIKNKYHVIEFFLHLFISITFWLKVSLLGLPESLRKAYPVFKFFVTLVLYIIVVILIFIFDISFKFFSFFK